MQQANKTRNDANLKIGQLTASNTELGQKFISMCNEYELVPEEQRDELKAQILQTVKSLPEQYTTIVADL